jgi:hypothetical protein
VCQRARGVRPGCKSTHLDLAGCPRERRRAEHRDRYSALKEHLGQHLDAPAVVKPFHRGQLVKAYPRQELRQRVADPVAEKVTKIKPGR